MRQLVCQICYTKYHVLLYLWLIGSVLKHCKVAKYCDQDLRLRKAPKQIIIHAGTNDISNSTNYLKNIVTLLKVTCKDTKGSSSSVICRTDTNDSSDPINTTNS